jgi:hypothetical protein
MTWGEDFQDLPPDECQMLHCSTSGCWRGLGCVGFVPSLRLGNPSLGNF